MPFKFEILLLFLILVPLGWGGFKEYEFQLAPFRFSANAFAPLRIECTAGDENLDMPLWTAGFFRAGFSHPSFRVGIQLPLVPSVNLLDNNLMLKGGLGVYGSVNVNRMKIGFAVQSRNPEDTKNMDDLSGDPQIFVTKDSLNEFYSYRYSTISGFGTFLLEEFSVLGISSRMHLGGNFIGYTDVVHKNPLRNGKFIPDSSDRSQVFSPFLKIEYCSLSPGQIIPDFEGYLQVSTRAASILLVINLNQSWSLGGYLFYNMNSSLFKESGLIPFLTLRARFGALTGRY